MNKQDSCTNGKLSNNDNQINKIITDDNTRTKNEIKYEPINTKTFNKSNNCEDKSKN
jgi:hypothetical protein